MQEEHVVEDEIDDIACAIELSLLHLNNQNEHFVATGFFFAFWYFLWYIIFFKIFFWSFFFLFSLSLFFFEKDLSFL